MNNSRFDTKDSQWKVTHSKYPDFYATSSAGANSVLIGPQQWTIGNDSQFCGKNYIR